jgi:endoglucanase
LPFYPFLHKYAKIDVMLKIKDKSIVDEKGSKLTLKGISLGGWLMMEGYMLGGENIPESKFKEDLRKKVGKKLFEEFVWEFRKRFINDRDVLTIKKLGFNCVRLPFNYKLIEKAPFKIDPKGMSFLVKAVKSFTDQKIMVILDMHAVPGCQNEDWHSDSGGKALFFKDPSFRERYVFLWEQISKRFKDFSNVAGYDIMNEPVTDRLDILLDAYAEVIKTVRKNGDGHIIFLEGNNWAQEVGFLKDLVSASENAAYSIHFYEPFQYTFNQYPNYTYPGIIAGRHWDDRAIRKRLSSYARLNAPVYVGEFGVASRCPHCFEEVRWVKDVLGSFADFKFHYTYWTYKSVAGMHFPDGLFQSYPKLPGMNNIAPQLLNGREEYYSSLATKNFKLNGQVMRVLNTSLS